MTWWEHFLAEAVPLLLMGVIASAALGTATWVLVAIVGAQLERRRRRQARAQRWAAFEDQLQRTVPLRTSGGDR